MSIGSKLMAGFAAVLGLMILSAVVIYFAVANMNENAEALSVCDDMLIGVHHSVAALRGDVILRGKANIDFTDERKKEWDNIDVAFEKLKEIYSNASSATDRANFNTIKNSLEPLRDAQREVEEAVDKATQGTAAAGSSDPTSLVNAKSAPLADGILKALRELRASAQSGLDAASRTVYLTLLLATLAAVAVAATIAVLLSRSITRAVRGLLGAVQKIATGDLTSEAIDVGTKDEIGQLGDGFNEMVKSLRRILADATRSANEVAVASTQIATGAQQQLTSLNETATSLNEITATAEEFKATMQEFADRARAVQEAASETAQLAAEGRTLTTDSATRIDQVRNASQAAGESVLNLSEQMQRIGEITATVNEIAEQTKLLALNASIEAARAGENGRGFAVVATQVRELANQSKESAARIEGLVVDTQKSMQDVVRRIQEGSRLSEDSVDTVRQVARSFKQIAQAIDQTREAMVQINTGAVQQEQGIAQLVTSITQIDSASKESLAAAEQTQKSIVTIDERIQSLNNSIARFKT